MAVLKIMRSEVFSFLDSFQWSDELTDDPNEDVWICLLAITLKWITARKCYGKSLTLSRVSDTENQLFKDE